MTEWQRGTPTSPSEPPKDQLADWQGRAERQYDENVSLIAKLAETKQARDQARYDYEQMRQLACVDLHRAEQAEAALAAMTQERDAYKELVDGR